MPAYHIVLFQLKSGASQGDIDSFITEAKAMVGQVPGLSQIEAGPVLASTAHRAKGYDYGLIGTLESGDQVQGYIEHPSHKQTHAARLKISEETLAFDLVTA